MKVTIQIMYQKLDFLFTTLLPRLCCKHRHSEGNSQPIANRGANSSNGSPGVFGLCCYLITFQELGDNLSANVKCGFRTYTQCPLNVVNGQWRDVSPEGSLGQNGFPLIVFSCFRSPFAGNCGFAAGIVLLAA